MVNENWPETRWIFLLCAAVWAIVACITIYFAAYSDLLDYGRLSEPPSDQSNYREYTEIKTEYEYENRQKSAFQPDSSSERSGQTESSKQKNKSDEVALVTAINHPDIAAQEGMWRAANAIVALTIVQILVGSLTLYFLVMTFRTQRSELGAAQRAADAAQETLESSRSAERAYIELKFDTNVDAKPGQSRGVCAGVFIQTFVHNAGNTPAVIESEPIVNCDSGPKQDPDGPHMGNQFWPNALTLNGSIDTINFVGAGDSLPIYMETSNRSFDPLEFYGLDHPFHRQQVTVKYRDINNKRYIVRFETEFFFSNRFRTHYETDQAGFVIDSTQEGYIDDRKPIFYTTQRTEKQIHRAKS